MGMRDLLLMPMRQLVSGPEPAFTSVGGKLLNQQHWCWGRDICHPQGNLLLKFGFCRRRPPTGISGSSCYRVTLNSGREVLLWGFGTLIADRGSSLYLGRFDFEPQLCATLNESSPCWSPGDLPPLSKPVLAQELSLAGSLCSEVSNFIGDYESWVAETVGIDYRQQTIEEFKHSTYSAAEAKRLWPRLAKQVSRHYNRRASASKIGSPEGRYYAQSG